MQLPRNCCVEPAMSNIRMSFLLSAALLGGCVAPPPMPLGVAGGPPSFAAFGEDEDACRREGTEAIQAGADAQDAGGPAAARRYDYAYQRCMFIHGRNRQMQAAARAAPPDASAERENLHSFDQPDAFYSVPYATPGYGYDGFSW